MSVDALSFTVFAAAMVGTPGPANMVILSAGARYGFRRALPMVTGVLLGKQFIIWPIGFGVMGVIAGVPWLFTALKLAPMPVTVISAAPIGDGASSAWAPLTHGAWGM